MPGNKAPAASWSCCCLINRHTFHCMSAGNYRVASNQRFMGTHHSVQTSQWGCWSMPGLLQPISIHFMAGNTAGVILFYMKRSPLI